MDSPRLGGTVSLGEFAAIHSSGGLLAQSICYMYDKYIS